MPNTQQFGISNNLISIGNLQDNNIDLDKETPVEQDNDKSKVESPPNNNTGITKLGILL